MTHNAKKGSRTHRSNLDPGLVHPGQDTLGGQSLCPRGLSGLEQKNDTSMGLDWKIVPTVQPTEAIKVEVLTSRTFKLVFHTSGLLNTSIMPVEFAHIAPQPSFAFAWLQTDGLGKPTVSETPCQREGATTDRHHQGLFPIVKTHAACLLSEGFWWQEDLAK